MRRRASEPTQTAPFNYLLHACEVTILVSEPLRPVLVLNPLWEKPTATAPRICRIGCPSLRRSESTSQLVSEVVLLHGLLQSGPMLERLARGLSKGLGPRLLPITGTPSR